MQVQRSCTVGRIHLQTVQKLDGPLSQAVSGFRPHQVTLNVPPNWCGQLSPNGVWILRSDRRSIGRDCPGEMLRRWTQPHVGSYKSDHPAPEGACERMLACGGAGSPALFAPQARLSKYEGPIGRGVPPRRCRGPFPCERRGSFATLRTGAGPALFVSRAHIGRPIPSRPSTGDCQQNTDVDRISNWP